MGGWGLVYYYIELLRQGKHGVGLVIRLLRTALFYPRGAMWFVLACIVSSILLQLVLRYRISRIKVSVVAVILYLFALIGNTYYFLIEGTSVQKVIDVYRYIFYSVRNGCFMFIFFWLGYLLSCSDIDNWIQKNRKQMSAVLIISYFCLIFEVYFCYGRNTVDDNSLFMVFPVLIPMVFFFAREIKLTDSWIYREARRLSSFCFFVHPFLTAGISLFLEFKTGFSFYIIVLLILLLLYAFLRKLDNNVINKFI